MYYFRGHTTVVSLSQAGGIAIAGRRISECRQERKPMQHAELIARSPMCNCTMANMQLHVRDRAINITCEVV